MFALVLKRARENALRSTNSDEEETKNAAENDGREGEDVRMRERRGERVLESRRVAGQKISGWPVRVSGSGKVAAVAVGGA